MTAPPTGKNGFQLSSNDETAPTTTSQKSNSPGVTPPMLNRPNVNPMSFSDQAQTPGAASGAGPNTFGQQKLPDVVPPSLTGQSATNPVQNLMANSGSIPVGDQAKSTINDLRQPSTGQVPKITSVTVPSGGQSITTVSYTHLTLPTILLV